jgi:hypothetical protein
MNDNKNNRAGVLLRFVFPNLDDNRKLLDFLANDNMSIALRKSMLSSTYNTIKSSVDGYV